MGKGPLEVRGARDLAELWRALPAAVLRYRMAAPPRDGIAELSNSLRHGAWVDHCAAAADQQCAAAGRNCAFANTGRCRADILFPVHLGGGAPQWRMATLLVQWRPSASELCVVALGETACQEIGWAARHLRRHYDLRGAAPSEARSFADLELAGAGPWRLSFVTPWIAAKANHGVRAVPSEEAVLHDLGKSMASRAQKFTALCTPDPVWQRLGGHLARYAADAVLGESLKVDEVRIKTLSVPLQSGASGARFEALAWLGDIALAATATAAPWLSLLNMCGGGENADKGFGGVEIVPLQ